LRRRVSAAIAAIAAFGAFGVTALTAPQGQDPSLAEALTKAGAYVAGYRTKASGVALDEMLLLTEVGGVKMQVPRRVASDVVLLNISDRLLGMRDPYAIDTKPTRAPGPRIVNELKEPTVAAWQRVEQYAREGAHYLMANVVLWYSEPTLALRFIETDNQPGIEYKLEGRKRLNNVQTIGIGFKEKRSDLKKYLLATPSNPHSSGRIWVDPATGAIHMTELWVQSDTDTARVQVNYALDATTGLLVPKDAAHSFDERERGTGMSSMGAGGAGRRMSFEANAKYTNPKYTAIDLSKIIR
jgi:hypothetical protein